MFEYCFISKYSNSITHFEDLKKNSILLSPTQFSLWNHLLFFASLCWFRRFLNAKVGNCWGNYLMVWAARANSLKEQSLYTFNRIIFIVLTIFQWYPLQISNIHYYYFLIFLFLFQNISDRLRNLCKFICQYKYY